MSLQHVDLPPPSYSSHLLNDLKLPDMPPASYLAQSSPPQLPTLEPLPSMATLTHALDAPHHKPTHAHHRRHVKPLQLPSIHDMIPPEITSPTDTGSVASFDTVPRRRNASVAMQDADDRMAAEALCGLGKVESNQSQKSRSSYESIRQSQSHDEESHSHRGSNEHPEPFLQLLTSSHPWLGGTINNSLSAYSSTKSNSPRIIQYGADFVERNIGSPVASTVGSVGRRTGMEGRIRNYLDSRRLSDLERIDPDILNPDTPAKRRRVEIEENSAMDIDDHDSNSRRKISEQSVDTLPAYDENRSPEYEETPAPETPKPILRQFRPSAHRSWSTQLMISTSGLGAALNEASLRSLRYCLHILRSANKHVRDLMEMLKRLLSDYERAPHSPHRLEDGHNSAELSNGHTDDSSSQNMAAEPMLTNGQQHQEQQSAETIAKHIQRLNDEIWQTLKNVVTSVSRYTGGALPERAADLVKSQLLSVPHRWQRAVSNSSTEASSSSQPQQPNGTHPETSQDFTDAVGSAHRMLAFAIEGIDMMEQVGGVVDSTIVSAEAWLDRMGRPRGRLEADDMPPVLSEPDAASATVGASPASRTSLESEAILDGLHAPQPQPPAPARQLE